MKVKWVVSLVVGFLLLSCERSLPTIQGIDLKAWKEDKNACRGSRTSTMDTLQMQRSQLQGLTEMQIVSLLGRPDQTELYSRNQKFYYYVLEPGKACGIDKVSKRLSVRFNATGRAKEVVVE